MHKLKMSACHLLLLLLFLCTVPQSSVGCKPGEWWNPSGLCVTCTNCPEVVLRTCQPHKDTVCGSFQDIEINLIHAIQEEYSETAAGNMDQHTNEDWLEILLIIAAITSVVFVFAALYLMHAHRRQWNKMQQLDEEMEQDISRLVEKLAEVPNIQSTTAVLVDEGQIKKQKGSIPFRWIYLDQLLGKTQKKVSAKCGNVYTERTNR